MLYRFYNHQQGVWLSDFGGKEILFWSFFLGKVPCCPKRESKRNQNNKFPKCTSPITTWKKYFRKIHWSSSGAIRPSFNPGVPSSLTNLTLKSQSTSKTKVLIVWFKKIPPFQRPWYSGTVNCGRISGRDVMIKILGSSWTTVQSSSF